jgi:hypothetical protein
MKSIDSYKFIITNPNLKKLRNLVTKYAKELEMRYMGFGLRWIFHLVSKPPVPSSKLCQNTILCQNSCELDRQKTSKLGSKFASRELDRQQSNFCCFSSIASYLSF